MNHQRKNVYDLNELKKGEVVVCTVISPPLKEKRNFFGVCYATRNGFSKVMGTKEQGNSLRAFFEAVDMGIKRYKNHKVFYIRSRDFLRMVNNLYDNRSLWLVEAAVKMSDLRKRKNIELKQIFSGTHEWKIWREGVKKTIETLGKREYL